MNQNERIVIVGCPGGLSTARAYHQTGGRGRVILLTAESYPPYSHPPLTKEYLRDEIERDELPIENTGWAGTVIAGGEVVWSSAPGFWSTIGDKTLKYHSWSGGWDEAKFVDHVEEGDAEEPSTVWYGRDGVCGCVLTHNFDEDYEEGRKLIERGASLP